LAGNGETVAATAWELRWSGQSWSLLTLSCHCNTGQRCESLWSLTQVNWPPCCSVY